jgi:lysophospholipase L1-like esterase
MLLKKSRALWLLPALLCLTAGQRHVKIVLTGDSTVNDEGGWGTGFAASFNENVEVVNLAKNGRSSKSFRDEGLWAPVETAKADYVLIQFGHNDVPGKGADRETVAETTYRENLARYVAEARAAGAIPVLVTSIVRRNFTPDGKIKPDSLVPYVQAVRKLAAEENVSLLDLYSLTLAQAERLGPSGTEELNAIDKDGNSDHTHLGPKGRREIGAMAAHELVKVVPKLQPYVAEATR